MRFGEQTISHKENRYIMEETKEEIAEETKEETAEDKAKVRKAKKKRNNIITAIVIVAMLLAAGAVILSVKGLPEVANPFDNIGKSDEEELQERNSRQEEVLGEWVSPDDETFVIDVWRDGSGEFHAMINRSEAENDIIFWEMDGAWQDYLNGFQYTNCKKTRVTYDSDGNATENVEYEDGAGSISGNQDDGLTWDDKKEKAGKDVTFTYSGEY